LSLHDARILTALLKAKARLALGNVNSISRWTSITCPACGHQHRAVTSVDGGERTNNFGDTRDGRCGQADSSGQPGVVRFNPNHDPNTGEFSGGGSGRLKALAKFKAGKRSEAKDLSKSQAKEWQENLKDQRRERNNLRRDQRRERSKLIKSANKKLAKLTTPSSRNEHRRETKADLASLAVEHQGERQSLLHEQKMTREGIKDTHKQDRESFKFGLHVDAKSEGFKKKSRVAIEGITRKLVMASSQTSKASSAEAILRHCLQTLGYTKAYRQGTLSNEQHLRLVEEIRLYGRAWLKHEAETSFISFVSVPSDSERGIRPAYSRVLRASKWIEGSGGFLIQQDSGFRHAVDRFFGRAKSFVRELILSATLALSGPAPLTGEELASADQEAQKQEQYFDRFHQEILAPKEKLVAEPISEITQFIDVLPAPMTPGQFVARAESYADSAWQAAQRINHGQAIAQGQWKFERRVLGSPKTEHCEDCPSLAAMGWQPIGTLPAIGDSACGSLCLCHFRYSVGEGEPEFIQGKRGPMRAPSEVSILEETGESAPIAGSP
jgi:hypothetical protein